jgi:regulator of sirC expression with transglutaminase-like and TPR domain
VFGLFGRRRNNRPGAQASCPTEPEAQVQLVCETVAKIDEVRRLVSSLPELPIGDRGALLAQLGATAENLRALYFLDAIY